MSVSSLPEWKQLLLEKKRREEEERERREKEEEEKFASMPAWKRGIIQRRKAKQENLGDREKEREVCLLQADVRSPSDCFSDMDSSVTVNLGSDLLLSPDPGLWLDGEPNPASQVSVETIVPLHENPFILTQCTLKKGRDAEIGNELEIKDKLSPRSQDGESGRGRDIELKIERFRDRSEGRERERSMDRSQGRERDYSRERYEKDKSQWKETVKDAVREQEFLKVRKDTEDKETSSPSGSFSPLVPCLHTIRADNIIIIEQDRKSSDEKKGRWREVERERPEEDHQGKKGVKMDLREILAGGGSVTEIRASEVLIIKPSASPEDRSTGGRGREEGEIKGSMDVRRENVGRELRTDQSWLREKEKERPWGQATVINKDERKDSLDDNVFVERGGRVSQLLSKFGEHPKPPSRSKSSDNFLEPGRRKYSGDQDDQQSEERKGEVKSTLLKGGVPKRSFSFSDRVICGKENGLGDGQIYCERKTRARIHSDRSAAPWVDVATFVKEKVGCARLLDRDRFLRHRDAGVKAEDEKVRRQKIELIDKRALEKMVDADGDMGFTVASVKNTEGISFARRMPIRQDGKAKAEKEVKRLMGEKSSEKQLDKDSPAEVQGCVKSKVALETSYVAAASAELLSPCQAAAESHRRHVSAFTDCSMPTERPPHHRGPEWTGSGPQGAYLTHSVLSQHTEDLISKIEKIGETSTYCTDRGERANKAAYEMTKEEVQTGFDCGSDTAPRSPKRITIPPGPLEIQIPRTVFYVAEEMVETKQSESQSSEGQDREGGRGVERRDSWRIGKPLSRIESLREKIRQRELEKQQQMEMGGSEAPVMCNTATDRSEERVTETAIEWEAAAHVQKWPVEAERGQEDGAAQASTAAFDVTREVCVLKTCPHLPVSVPQSQAVSGEEVTSASTASEASKDTADSLQISEDEEDPLKHVGEQLRHHRSHQDIREEEKEEEGTELSEEEEEAIEEYTSPLDPALSLTPSPPVPNSVTTMSRIYNLETVSSRSGLYLRDRPPDISSSVHLVKVKPLMSNSPQEESGKICGVQTIQQQIEQFQLKEQEAHKLNAPVNYRDTKSQQSSKGVLKQQQQVKVDAKSQEKEKETTELNPKVSLQQVCSPTSQLKQTITVNPSLLRSHSPDNTLKATDSAPTPASSPSSPSPAPSPSISPSPSPSPTLFSIRSASGGQVKRGATITIAPKKSGGAAGATAKVTTAGTAKTPAQQQPPTPTVVEPVKKRYPTAEEIEVIGGYQNLEKSCMVKNKGTPKKGKVCFNEVKLEQVCEYPSETFMLGFTQNPQDLLTMEKLQGEDTEEEQGDMEGGAVVVKSTRSLGTSAGPRLKMSLALGRLRQNCPCDEVTNSFTE
ncbi:uncharacterized protein ppp1r18 [Pholidichthys leucotaenia]